jgi:hypothetical protein
MMNPQFEASGSKKVINVSIDLIKDAADLDRSSAAEDSHLEGGNWIVIDRST